LLKPEPKNPSFHTVPLTILQIAV